MAGAAASPTLEATDVFTALVTTGVLTGAVEAVVLLHVADVAGVLATAGVATCAVTAARRAKAVMEIRVRISPSKMQLALNAPWCE